MDPKHSRDEEFDPTHDGDRYLIYGAPTGRWSKGYTDIPGVGMGDEPQCLSRLQYEKHIKPPAHPIAMTAAEVQGQREKQWLSQEERIQKAMDHAKEKRRDVSREKWILDRMLAKRRKPHMIEKRVRVLEQMAYLGRTA